MPGLPGGRLYLQEPEWTWLLAIEMFFGGIAAGTYFAYALMRLFGNKQDEEVARRIGFVPLPAMLVVALLLIIDLGQPLRFLNLIFTSGSAVPERGGPLMFNPQSPMTWGSYAITAFGLFTLIAFLDSLAHDGRYLKPMAGGEALAHNGIWLVLGALFALAAGAYSGIVVNVSQQTVWTDTILLGALFVATATLSGFGVAAIAANIRRAESTARAVKDALLWVGAINVILIAAFIASLGDLWRPFALGTVTGPLFWVGVVVLGLAVPAGILLFYRTGVARQVALAGAFVLVGVLAFRLTVLYSSIAALHG